MTDSLSALIRRSGRSYAQIAADAGISKARVGQFALGQSTTAPTPRTVHGLAYALGVDSQTILDAIAGEISPASRADAIASRIASLPDDRRAVIEATLAALEAMR
ncbi:hypothetical protein [Actinomyces timonensis]|uniref:hypothetical protein n=1 Tax=Actinomyces timonensis TaxID=1288391 RepID=UPI0002EB86B6|nr:hypothetical protein [Actinomyces timonensis]